MATVAEPITRRSDVEGRQASSQYTTERYRFPRRSVDGGLDMKREMVTLALKEYVAPDCPCRLEDRIRGLQDRKSVV